MVKRRTWIFISFIIIFGCKDKTTKKYTDVPSKVKSAKQEFSIALSGKKLMETQCYVCHSPTAPEKENRIGPPMIEIKANYIDKNTTKEEFINTMWDFVKEPTKNKTKLHQAVDKYGVMPYQSFRKEDIDKIGEYMYEYEIEEPSWFEEYWKINNIAKNYINSGKKILPSDKEYTTEDIGLKYALDTKKVLGKNLMGAIQKKGTLEALVFCNERAYPLTDSMANAYNVLIKRVSDKPRNPKNIANTSELDKINTYKKSLLNRINMNPIIENKNGVDHFYYPIVTNSMCLQCHGEPKQNIKPEVLAEIKNLYPKDMAKGYKVNQLRGIWSITFLQKE